MQKSKTFLGSVPEQCIVKFLENSKKRYDEEKDVFDLTYSLMSIIEYLRVHLDCNATWLYDGFSEKYFKNDIDLLHRNLKLGAAICALNIMGCSKRQCFIAFQKAMGNKSEKIISNAYYSYLKRYDNKKLASDIDYLIYASLGIEFIVPIDKIGDDNNSVKIKYAELLCLQKKAIDELNSEQKV